MRIIFGIESYPAVMILATFPAPNPSTWIPWKNPVTFFSNRGVVLGVVQQNIHMGVVPVIVYLLRHQGMLGGNKDALNVRNDVTTANQLDHGTDADFIRFNKCSIETRGKFNRHSSQTERFNLNAGFE